jgi:hypothetical protein
MVEETGSAVDTEQNPILSAQAKSPHDYTAAVG